MCDLDAGGLRLAVRRAHEQSSPANPETLLGVACAAEPSAEFDLRRDLLTELGAREDLPDPLRIAIRLEIAVDAARGGDPDRAESLTAPVIDDSTTSPVARGRALYAAGLAASWRGGSTGKIVAERLLGEAAPLLLEAEEPEWATQALVILGFQVAYCNGDLDHAVEHLRAARAATDAPNRVRAVACTFLGDALAVVGLVDEADDAVAEATEVGRRLGDRRIQAYASWAAAMSDAVRGDVAALLEHLHEVERHPGDWFVRPAGAEFLASAADVLGRVGDPAAAAYLDRAERAAVAVGYPEIAALARAAYEARVGDPARAGPLLDHAVESDETPPREHWRILLLSACAAARRGDRDQARKLEAQARRAAERLGHPKLPELHEPTVVKVLDGATAFPRARVEVLGGFRVAMGGHEVSVPAGLPRRLVAMLALRGGEATVEELIDTLWPESDLDVGRQRMRNLLNRLRRHTGDLVCRSDTLLRLAATIDLVELEQLTRRALAADDSNRLQLTRDALALYRGDVLPADLYDDWTASARERARRWRLALLGVLARDAEAASDLDAALNAVDLAIDTDPLDESRYHRAARLARKLDDEARAKAYEKRVLAVRAELGLD